jgi:SAM-dependent MidA family methyltransferase
MASLPIPSQQAQAVSQQLAQLIQQKIKKSGGCISFAEFMQMALYTPGLGYYAGGAQKFGKDGDFVTAPEISPLFAQTLARQYAQLQANIHAALSVGVLKSSILELGAGTGKLAVELLLELEHLNALPAQYFILEVSAHLRQVQREICQDKLPRHLYEKLVWLDELPKKFNGLVLGNEVLDAVPVRILHKTAIGWTERGVAFEGDFVWQDTTLSALNLAENFPQDLIESLPVGYITEVNPAACALVRSLADMLETGAILLIDYGFGATEYYHPQRNQGTLMCHFQQMAHDNPLVNVGLQDITAHVDFTSIASVLDMPCKPISMRLAGYVNQAQFLINCGMLDILAQHSPNDSAYIKMAAAAQKLLSPAEMGELFKVICFTKNIDEPLIGFAQGDKAHTL